MPGDERVIDIPLIGGLSEKSGAVVLEPPSFSRLENVRFDKLGDLEQRYGFKQLTTTATPGYIEFTATNQGALVGRSGNGDVWNYLTDAGDWRKCAAALSTAAAVPATPCDVSTDTAHASRYPVESLDAACHTRTETIHGASKGMRRECYVWIENGSLYAMVREVTGAVIVPARNIGSGVGSTWDFCRVVTIDSSFYVIASDNSTALYGYSIDASAASPSWSSATTIHTGAPTYAPFDVDANDPDNEIILAYFNDTDTVVERLNTSFSVQSTWTLAGTVADDGLAVRYDSNRVLLLYGHSGNLYGASKSDTFATSYFTPTVIKARTLNYISNIDGIIRNGQWFVSWSEVDTTDYKHLTSACDVSYTGGTIGTRIDAYHVTLAARMFVDDWGSVYVPAMYYQNKSGNGAIQYQPRGVLLGLHDNGSSEAFSPVAHFLVSECAYQSSTLPHTTWTTDDDLAECVFFACGAYGPNDADTSTEDHTKACRVRISFPGGASKFVEYDGVTYWGGGQLWAFDGAAPSEACPVYYPENVSAVDAGAGGSLSAGDYAWKVVYEWEDDRGVLHRSAPSLAATATITASHYAKVHFPRLDVTAHDGTACSAYRVAVYRTEADGSVFYLAGRFTTFTASTVDGFVYVSDTHADTALGELLYTEGDALEAVAPPPVRDLEIAKGRMWIASADRRNELWYSKPLERTVAPEFNPALVLDVPEGEIQALASMDDKIIAFTKTKIFAVYGEGPNATGAGGQFPTPQVVASDTGCISRGSVLSGPFGVVFQGARGIFLLTRALEVKFIGESVQNYEFDSTGFGTVVSATIAQDTEEVRFACDSGVVLVWCYHTGQWAAWTGLSGHTHGCTWGDEYVTVNGDTKPRILDSANNGDDFSGSETGDDIVIQTGWIRLDSIHAFQRLRRIYVAAKRSGTCGMVVKAAYDYSTSFTTLKTFASSDLSTSIQSYRVHVPTQKCSAVQIQVTSNGFAAGTGTLTVHGLSVGIKPKRGGAKLPQARSA